MKMLVPFKIHKDSYVPFASIPTCLNSKINHCNPMRYVEHKNKFLFDNRGSSFGEDRLTNIFEEVWETRN